MKALVLTAALAAVCLARVGPAAAYACAASPKGDVLILHTANPYPAVTAGCTVTCRIASPDARITTVTCKQNIPPAAKGWYVCLRPTGGKPYKPLDGSENCVKQ